MSSVGDSNCLGQMQLRQSTANISHGFRWGQEGDRVNLSFKPTLISAVCVCSMPRSTRSPSGGPWMALLGRDVAGDMWASDDVPHQPMGRAVP